MHKRYRLTYTLYTDLGKRTCVETFCYFETVLQVLRNLANHCNIDNIKIEVIKWWKNFQLNYMIIKIY